MIPALGLVFVLAACSILYELLLAQTLSALLGNTVLRYSITIGCYLGALGLGAMLCQRDRGPPAVRLVRVELALSLVGGLSVPAFFVFDGVARFVSGHVDVANSTIAIALLIATHAIIILIGLLSGFELPMLMALGEERRPGSGNTVLGVDYFGALVGSVLFPLVLLPQLGLLTTCFTIALLNLAALAVLVIDNDLRLSPLASLVAGCAAFGLAGGLAFADRLEQNFVAQLYFPEDVQSLTDISRPSPHVGHVERHHSPYQTIDIVRRAAPDQWVFNVLRDRPRATEHPDDVWLYLQNDFQLFSGGEEQYHEWFVHVPIEARGSVPPRVLLVGGGDGLALRELVRYPSIEHIVQVELDPQVIELATTHPALAALHDDPWQDPRVELVFDDAFAWLRSSSQQFDAVYIDLPYPRNHDLSKVFSREFYGMLRQRLHGDAFLTMDAPSGWCGSDLSDWPIYSATLDAAGFRGITPFLSRVPYDAQRVARAVDRIDRMVLRADDSPREYVDDAARAIYRAKLERALNYLPQHEFIFAWARPRQRNPTWRDLGVQPHTLGPDEYAVTFDDGCPRDFAVKHVNTLFRPTLPQLDLSTLLTY